MIEWRRSFAIPLSTRWAICIWVILLLGVSGRVAVARVGAQSVVPIYLMAGERWWDGERLYAPPPPGLDVYRNPPGFAALFAPLSRLPPKPVALLWRLLGIGLFALGLRRFLAAVNPVSLTPQASATVWIVAAFFVLPAFNNGQANLMLIASALLGTAAFARGRWWGASGWTMFAATLKGYPIALAGLLFLLAPRRLFWRLPIALAAFLAAPLACQNPEYVLEQFREFRRAMAADERGEAPLDRTPKGWTYLVRIGTGESASPEAVTIAAAVSGLLLAGAVRRGSRRTGGAPLAGHVLCAALLWMVVFGPATEMNTYSILAPVGWLAVAPGQPRWSRAVAGLGIGLLLAAALRGGAFPMNPAVSLASLQPLGAILLIGVAVRTILIPSEHPVGA